MKVETIKFSDFMNADKSIKGSGKSIKSLDKEIKVLKELAYFCLIALIGIELFSMIPQIFVGLEHLFR